MPPYLFGTEVVQVHRPLYITWLRLSRANKRSWTEECLKAHTRARWACRCRRAFAREVRDFNLTQLRVSDAVTLLRQAEKEEKAADAEDGAKKKKGGVQVPEEWPWEEAKKLFEKPDVVPASEVEV